MFYNTFTVILVLNLLIFCALISTEILNVSFDMDVWVLAWLIEDVVVVVAGCCRLQSFTKISKAL